MATISLLNAKMFGDRETQESLNREGISLLLFAIGVDLSTGFLAICIWEVV
jgi:hypothetical protein